MKRTEPTAISEILKDLFSDSDSFSKGMSEARAMNAWHRVVGQTLSDATIKLTLRESRLYVTFNSASARSEFFARRHEILKALNAAAGSKVINFIVVG